MNIDLHSALTLIIGFAMLLGGAYIARVATFQRAALTLGRVEKGHELSEFKSPGRIAWIVFFASLVTTLIFFRVSINAGRNDYPHMWPLFAFLISGLVFTVELAYIGGILVKKIFK